MLKIVRSFLDEDKRNQNEPEFMQAVTEVAETVIPYIPERNLLWPKYTSQNGRTRKSCFIQSGLD